jgi:hypothetical protein
MKIFLVVMTCVLLGRPKQSGELYCLYILFPEYGSYTHCHGNIESNKIREELLSIKHFLPPAITLKTF